MLLNFHFAFYKKKEKLLNFYTELLKSKKFLWPTNLNILL